MKLPFFVLAACAVLSVALACVGADQALALTKGYGVGLLACLAGLSAVVDCHYKKGDFEWDATKCASYPMTRQQFATWMDVYFE